MKNYLFLLLCTFCTHSFSFGQATYGCIDPLAANYDANANTDDGTCVSECQDVVININGGTSDWASIDTYNTWDITNADSVVVISGGVSEFGILATADTICFAAGTYTFNAGTTSSWSSNWYDDTYSIEVTCDSSAFVLANNGGIGPDVGASETFYFTGCVNPLGCTDSLANNYNPAASIDNNYCIYECIQEQNCEDWGIIYGCTLMGFNNYNPQANEFDDSCNGINGILGPYEYDPVCAMNGITYYSSEIAELVGFYPTTATNGNAYFPGICDEDSLLNCEDTETYSTIHTEILQEANNLLDDYSYEYLQCCDVLGVGACDFVQNQYLTQIGLVGMLTIQAEIIESYKAYCDLGDPNCACSVEYSPVCGTNGQSYPNSCFADCDGVNYSENLCTLEDNCDLFTVSIDSIYYQYWNDGIDQVEITVTNNSPNYLFNWNGYLQINPNFSLDVFYGTSLIINNDNDALAPNASFTSTHNISDYGNEEPLVQAFYTLYESSQCVFPLEIIVDSSAVPNLCYDVDDLMFPVGTSYNEDCNYCECVINDPTTNLAEWNCQTSIECTGCTDSLAANYDTFAIEDNGTCVDECEYLIIDISGGESNYPQIVIDAQWELVDENGIIRHIGGVDNYSTAYTSDTICLEAGSYTFNAYNTNEAYTHLNNWGDDSYSISLACDTNTYILTSNNGETVNDGDSDLFVIPECSTSIFGCMTPQASNYNPLATANNYLCEFEKPNLILPTSNDTIDLYNTDTITFMWETLFELQEPNEQYYLFLSSDSNDLGTSSRTSSFDQYTGSVVYSLGNTGTSNTDTTLTVLSSDILSWADTSEYNLSNPITLYWWATNQKNTAYYSSVSGLTLFNLVDTIFSGSHKLTFTYSGSLGCTDSLATSYNPNADIDDGSCVYDSEITEQNILLDINWNMFSSYIQVENTNLEDIFSDFAEDILILKDNLGLAYLPGFNFNGIGNLSPGAGYQVKLTATHTLTLQGEYLDPIENPITLFEGWNMIAYLPTASREASIVFQNVDDLVIVKDNLGLAYLPEYGFDGIGLMQAGQGYQVKVVSEQILQY